MLDVDALIHLVTHSSYVSNKPIVELINNARKPMCQVFAYNSSIAYKDLLRENRYRWNPNNKVWHKIITHDEMENERNWLTENIYQGNFSGQFVEITPIDKYKEQ